MNVKNLNNLDNLNDLDNLDNIDHSNNGLITKIWGGHLWESLHSITFGYPKSPQYDDKQKYKRFFIDLGDVLPCVYCRQSYKDFITTGNTIIDDSIFSNRETLTKWLYRLHEAVNKKLGFDYGITYDDIVKKYESYRAKCVSNEHGCVMPLNLKADSYKKGSEKAAPIIKFEIASKLIEYSAKRNFDMKIILERIQTINQKSNNWKQRDEMCWEIINNMRKNGIPSIEKKGEYAGLPTKEELKLISLLCTTIPACDLNNIVQRTDD